MEFDVIRTPFSCSEVMEILGISRKTYDDLCSFGLLQKSAVFGGRCSDQTNQHNFMDILHIAVWSKWDGWKAFISPEGFDELLTILDEEEFLTLTYESSDNKLDQFCRRLFPQENEEHRKLHDKFVMTIMEICKVIQSVFRASLSVLIKAECRSAERDQKSFYDQTSNFLKRYVAVQVF